MVRLEGPPQHGVIREREYVIVCNAADAGLAPALRHIDQERGITVTEYVRSASRRPSPAELCDTLQRVHALPRVQPAIDYEAYFERYWHDAGQPVEFADIRSQLRSVIENAPLGLCHHDPSEVNVVTTAGELFFIDWEYAAWGCPIFDFAVLVDHWKFDVQEVARLSGIEAEQLALAAALFRKLDSWWEASRANG